MSAGAALYAGQSRAGANRTHGVYGMRTAYKPYGTFSTISYFYGQPYGTIPYGMIITAVCTVRFILLATLSNAECSEKGTRIWKTCNNFQPIVEGCLEDAV